MPAVSTADLVNRAKAAADMRDNFVTPTQWMYWATQERMALDVLLAQSGWPLPYSVAQVDVAGGASAGRYPITTSLGFGIMAVVGVWEENSQGYMRPLKFENTIDFQRQIGGASGQSRGHSQTFRVQTITGDDVVYLNLWPEPATSETYVVAYIDHPLRLTLDVSPAAGFTNSVLYPLGWEERIVLGMARRALMKEESDTGEVDREIKLWEGRIEEACWGRVLGAVPSVRNTDALERGWTKDRVYPAYTNWYWL